MNRVRCSRCMILLHATDTEMGLPEMGRLRAAQQALRISLQDPLQDATTCNGLATPLSALSPLRGFVNSSARARGEGQ